MPGIIIQVYFGDLSDGFRFIALRSIIFIKKGKKARIEN